MNDLSPYERLGRIDDELALLDSSCDAKTRLIWQELDGIKRMVAELRDSYAHPHARGGVDNCATVAPFSPRAPARARGINTMLTT